jgi:hypothetical protein
MWSARRPLIFNGAVNIPIQQWRGCFLRGPSRGVILKTTAATVHFRVQGWSVSRRATEADESPLLRTVARKRLVKILQRNSHFYFYYFYYWWGGTKSTRYRGHFWPIVQTLDDRWGWFLEQLVEWRLAGETEVLGENMPRRHFVHHKIPQYQTRARTPDRRGGKPVTNGLSYGAANSFPLISLSPPSLPLVFT